MLCVLRARVEVGLNEAAELRRHCGHSHSAGATIQAITAIALEQHFGTGCRTWANQGATIQKVNVTITLHLQPPALTPPPPALMSYKVKAGCGRCVHRGELGGKFVTIRLHLRCFKNARHW